MVIEKIIYRITTTGRTIYKYLLECDFCKKRETIIGGRARHGKKKTCSKQCGFKLKKGKPIHTEQYKKTLSLKNSGENNPFYGKTHSKEKMQEIMQTKIANNTVDTWALRKNSMTEEEFKIWYDKYMVLRAKNPAFKGKHHTKATKELFSRQKTEAIANGTFNLQKSQYGLKGNYFSIKMQDNFMFDSFIEFLRMKMLDQTDEVISWTKKHKIIIPYQFNNLIKNYNPDFLIKTSSGITIIEELKGYEEENKKQAKFKALKEYALKNNFVSSIYLYEDIEVLCKFYFGKSISVLRKLYKDGKFK